jgi:hypothetical protein
MCWIDERESERDEGTRAGSTRDNRREREERTYAVTVTESGRGKTRNLLHAERARVYGCVSEKQ